MRRTPQLTAQLAAGFLLFAAPARAEDWPQWLGPKRDGVWRESGIAQRFPPGAEEAGGDAAAPVAS